MRTRTFAILYAVADLLVFAVGYYVLKIREMGLYLFLVVVGLPASCAVVPFSESVARQFEWSLGGGPHVWVSIVACVLVNVAIIAASRTAALAWQRRKRASSNSRLHRT
jgi:uncharacterized transporter YbjL